MMQRYRRRLVCLFHVSVRHPEVKC
jgi:hypothetical protein